MSDPRVLQRVGAVIAAHRGADPARSYVAKLCTAGHDAILRKLSEEATETLLAAKQGDTLNLVGEVADLWFHSLVLLSWHGLGPDDVLAELERREGISGIDAKVERT